MEKENLIREGEELLSCVKKRKVFGSDFSDEDCMDADDIKRLQTWLNRAEEYIERFGLECQKERLSRNSWIINNERVSVERIKNILSTIQSVRE